MTVQSYVPEQAITLTESAIRHMKAEIAKKPDAKAVRIAVKPSGCSGYMYDMELVAEAQAADIKLALNDSDLMVYLDPDSLPVLKGTELDLVKQGLNSILQFRNPNATAECGCGESFSTTK